MLDLHALYEIITFAIGDTKAGSKMGKLQVKNLDNGTVLNCILWEETLNRLDSKLLEQIIISELMQELTMKNIIIV